MYPESAALTLESLMTISVAARYWADVFATSFSQVMDGRHHRRWTGYSTWVEWN